jgi:hypothetical protein
VIAIEKLGPFAANASEPGCVDAITRRGSGTAVELVSVSALPGTKSLREPNGWPKNPRVLAHHLRRAQTSLRGLGIDIAFRREGRAGSRIITMRSCLENTVSTVSSVRYNGYKPEHRRPESRSHSVYTDEERFRR